ncbi:MAG: hypothetical protein QW199_01990 [Candidatus Pacearchaeota archaeon]
MEEKNKRKEKRACSVRARRAQQEVFGFVIIVLLVIVIGIIMLAFSMQRSLRKPTAVADIKVNSLLNAIMQYTSECNNKKISEVIAMCANNEQCDGGGNACDYLTKNLTAILSASFPTVKDGKGFFSGYNLTIGAIGTQPFISITGGEQKGNVVAGYWIVPIPPTTGQPATSVEARLYLYYRTTQT